MPTEPTILVLWATGFDEAVATLFVTQCRYLGLPVRLVGLTREGASGAYGLTLVPDAGLDEASHLAANAGCVVIPCPWLEAQQLRHDPRLGEFLRLAQANGARFTVGPTPCPPANAPPLFCLSAEDDLAIYPDAGELVPFVRQMAASVVGEGV